MTRKRYKKKLYGLLTRMYKDYGLENTGSFLKNLQKLQFNNVKFNSYDEAWESLKDIRKHYGM